MIDVDRTDSELADAARGGDRDALDALLRRHFDLVHAVCRRITSHPEDALDATQEALVAVVRGIGRYDGRAAFTTWLYRVATNAALDEVRRRSRRLPTVDEIDEIGGPAPGSSPESAAVARVDVERALSMIAPPLRAAVVLRDCCDLEYGSIAEVLDVPIGTVRSRIARGRSALAKILGNPMGTPERPTDEDL